MHSATITSTSFPSSLQARLDTRDAALWVSEPALRSVDPETLAAAIRLPWRLVVLEAPDATLEAAIMAPEEPDDGMVRRRGYPIVVAQNPADITLPPRSLPIYRLTDPDGGASRTLAGQLRRLSVLDALRRSETRDLVILVQSGEAVAEDVKALWVEGYRPTMTVVGNYPNLFVELDEWRRKRVAGGSVGLVLQDVGEFCRQLTDAYLSTRLGERLLVRVRDHRGATRAVDLSGADDPQHPLLNRYELIQEGNLQPLGPEDLSAEEVEGFFRDAAGSWRPYAANLPWDRHGDAWTEIRQVLRRLDRSGPDANTITFIRAESGSGGTTLARALAWTAAREGYPTLFARRVPFDPDSLEVVGFMNRSLERFGRSHPDEARLYEAPWLLIFDREHWEGRDAELRKFLRDLERSGRPTCVLVVTGPYASLEYLSSTKFREIECLTHEVPTNVVEEFGQHINRFLAPHGPVRSSEEWRAFFRASVVHAQSGVSSFWVALSFWLQRQIDMTETVQSWMYRQFQQRVADPDLRIALVDIAAMSTERRPLPDAMLPPSRDWPVYQKLDDLRAEVGGFGLLRLRLEGDRYWALAHDVLGRFLLNAIYFDPDTRRELGFEDARSAEHLRFLVLRRLSSSPALALAPNKAIAEDFPVNIFKIDPDHGHATLAPFWREALTALDEMPAILWRTSRALRHHSAISRRRIAKDRDLFPLEPGERVALLERAIEDIRFALESIPPAEYDEPDLNLLNSLARAYQDLQTEAAAAGAPPHRLERLRELAQEATRRAWQLNPDSPFVVETYALSLLAEAKVNAQKAGLNAVEVLNLLYTEMERDRSAQRRFELSRLAERAFDLLLNAPAEASDSANGDINTMVAAIRTLAAGLTSVTGLGLSDFPRENRLAAAEILSDPNARGNLQAVRMLYALKCLDAPLDFESQLELLESLSAGGYPVSPQHRLELAILLDQRSRYEDAEQVFRQLRPLWRTGEYFVQVPERLRWLLDVGAKARLQVTARVSPGSETRGFAQVQEMRNLGVPFRAEEFGQRQLKPGTPIRGYVSFGHNGPFLRPVTATAG